MTATETPRTADAPAPAADYPTAAPSGDGLASSDAVVTGSALSRFLRRVAWNLLPPLTFLGMVGLWWLAVEAFSIPAYLLPERLSGCKYVS